MSLLLSAGAMAEHDCKNVDLRSNLLGEVRSQGALGWCFAYVAADMYSVALNQRVSPLDIALNFYRREAGYNRRKSPSTKLTDWEGGRQDHVLDATKEWGICPDREFSGYFDGNPRTLIWMDKLAEEFNKLDNADRDEQITKKVYSAYPKLYRVFPMTSASKLRDAFVQSNNGGEFPLVEMADYICEDKRIDASGLLRQTIGSKAIRGTQVSIDFINMHLAKKRPVAIGYNSKALKDFQDKSPMTHISTIVGSRKVNNKCEYLLRNSWGDIDLNDYHKDLWSKKDGEYVWLPESMVRNMGVEYTAIFKAKK